MARTAKKRALQIGGVVLALLVGFSRMYLYMHYPTDVLAGAALGLINGFVAFIIIDKIYKAIDNKKSKLA